VQRPSDVSPAFGGTLPAVAVRDKSPSLWQRNHDITLQSLVAWRLQMSLDRVIHGLQAIQPLPPAEKADLATDLGLDGQMQRLADLFKTMGHSGRLTILCHLVDGEQSVTALEALLGQRQAAVSQQLARLRLEGLVTTRREGKTIYYALPDQRVIDLSRAMMVTNGVLTSSGRPAMCRTILAT
jgi:DNA-binding transcriptional ArsR family regulator